MDAYCIAFRPNIVVAGTAPFGEDTWKNATLGSPENQFAFVKPCTRCGMINIDQTQRQKSAGDATGVGATAPPRRPGSAALSDPRIYATLAKYRRRKGVVHFGQYVQYCGRPAPGLILQEGSVVNVDGSTSAMTGHSTPSRKAKPTATHNAASPAGMTPVRSATGVSESHGNTVELQPSSQQPAQTHTTAHQSSQDTKPSSQEGSHSNTGAQEDRQPHHPDSVPTRPPGQKQKQLEKSKNTPAPAPAPRQSATREGGGSGSGHGHGHGHANKNKNKNAASANRDNTAQSQKKDGSGHRVDSETGSSAQAVSQASEAETEIETEARSKSSDSKCVIC